MRDIAFAAFFMAYLPLAFRYPHIGAMLWAWLSFESPDVYLFGFMTFFPLSKIIAVFTVLTLLVTQDGRKIYFDTIMMLFLVFLVQGLFSASFSDAVIDENWTLYAKVAKIIALCFVINSVVTTRLRMYGMLIAIALGLAFNGADEGLKVLLSGGGHHVLGVITFGDNNQFAVAILMCMPILLFLYQTSANRVARWGYFISLVLCGISVIGTYSRGGFIGLVTFALGLIALNKNKLRNLVLVAVAGVVLLFSAPESWFARINSIGSANTDGSFMERVTSWKIGTLIAMDRPLLGAGFHAQQQTSIWQHYGAGLSTFDWIPSAPQQAAGLASHSIYFELLSDTGFSGFAIFMSLLFTGLIYCGQLRKRAAPHPDLAWLGELGGMLRLSLIVYMVSGAALSLGYFEGLYLILALISVARHMLKQELSQRTVDDFDEDILWREGPQVFESA